MCAWNASSGSPPDEETLSAERRALNLFVEGAAAHQIRVDSVAQSQFRSATLRDCIRLTEPQSETDLLMIVGAVLKEFETYRELTERTIEARQTHWRQLASMLLHFIGPVCELDNESVLWLSAIHQLNAAKTQLDLETLRGNLHKYLTNGLREKEARAGKKVEVQDRSVANDNAAGLRGGGAAIEHLRTMIANARPGYVCLFRLSCLDVVGERFGDEGIQDCLMAVSAFLIEHLRIEDSVYHWSEASLLAICDRKIREEVLTAELNRILSRNRDFTIHIGERTIMLRIPILLEIYSIAEFETAEDLQNLALLRNRAISSLSPAKSHSRSNA
jgi:GGDEF domain-containing protein